MILLIDNYDSFSYNLFQLIGTFTEDITIIRNDLLSVDQIEQMGPKAIVLSPGPGKPSQAGVCIDVIKKLGATIPILGVCLGHQAICQAYGATITYAQQVMHGKQSDVSVCNQAGIFLGLPSVIQVARYHSLAASPETIPKVLKVTAITDTGEIMAVQHNKHMVYGVQFHPESILTPEGHTIIKNFLEESYD